MLTVNAQGASSGLSGLVELLVTQFLDSVTKYASSGRHFAYERRSNVGSLVGGRLDVTKSIRLRSRGLRHLLAFDREVASFSTPVNRSVLAALVEIEKLGRLVALSDEVLARARTLSMLFDDNRQQASLVLSRQQLAEAAFRLSETERDELVQDLLVLASVILSHESFDAAAASPTGLPRTWFLNLEKLFEKAVRSVLRRILKSPVFRGEDHPEAIFSLVADQYSANPDVVTGDPADRAIADVKYKLFEGDADASDIYQLLAHATAFGAKSAGLIFPADSYSVRSLGTSKDGTAVHLFGVRIPELDSDLAQVAAVLGMS